MKQGYDLVLVGYRSGDTRSALRFCDRSFAPGQRRRKILILNRPGLKDELGSITAGWECCEGSNKMAEFSGWQEGLDRLLVDGIDSSAVLFMNDTVCTHRHFTVFRALALKHAIREAAALSVIGFHDDVPGAQFAIDGLPLRRWVSTYSFALSVSAIELLAGRLYDQLALSACVPGGLDESRFFDRLSTDLEKHLQHWLFDGHWYGGGRLSVANAKVLHLKARCIVAELLLSAKCRSLHIDAVDPFERYPALEQLDRVSRRITRAWR